MSLPTPATVRTALADAERLRLAKWEGEYVRIVRTLEKASEQKYKLNEEGKLCAKHYIGSSVLDLGLEQWLQERFTRDNSEWNISVVRNPHQDSTYDSEPYAIVMVEK